MIQIRKIREYTPRGSQVSKKFDAALEPDLMVDNIEDIFQHPQDIIDKLPETERWNIFYTLGHVPGTNQEERKKRKWQAQDVIPFDIDDIEVVDNKPNPKYKEAIAKALKVDIDKCPILFSGNGLQVLIKPKFQITDAKWFEKNKTPYQVLCSKINDKLLEYGLKGEADVSAFAPNRLFRFPLTLNKKPGKPERLATLLNDSMETLDWDLYAASGIPKIDDSDSVSEKEMGYFKIDTEAVLTGCDFLKHIKENGDVVTEPEWYAADSILGRLEGGRELVHKWSESHPQYDEVAVNKKVDQALDASGPRTCDNINSYFGKCKECPNYKKQTSPIQLKGPDFIATSHSGFHLMGKRGALVPQYDDLRKFFYKEGKYINVKEHATTYRYNGTHFEPYLDIEVKGYAQHHFKPACDNKKAGEFHGIVTRTNFESADWLHDSTRKKLNLRNGVLDLETLELTPHTDELGFRFTLPFDYTPEARCPQYKAMLKRVLTDDEEVIQCFLEFMAYSVMGVRPISDVMMILLGDGGAGKSTILAPIQALLGDDKAGSQVSNLMLKQFEKDTHLVGLEHSLLNVCDELPKYADHDVWELLKNLAQGGTIRVDQKYKSAINFKNRCKFVFLGNSLPRGANPNEGFFRRLIILNCPNKFTHEEADLDLDTKIINTELSGVLNLIIEAYKTLKARHFHFVKPEASRRAVEAYRSDLDSVSSWLSEVKELAAVDGHAPIWLSVGAENDKLWLLPEMRKHYQSWCQENDIKPVGARVFAPRVVKWVERCGGSAEKSVKRVGGKATNVVIVNDFVIDGVVEL